MDECRTGDLVLELTSEEAVVPDGVGYDGDDVSISDGVGVVGEGEILAYYCGSVDISGYIDVDGVYYRPFDLRTRMAMYYGAGVIVIGCSGRITDCCGWFWLPPYEEKSDNCSECCYG